MFIIGDLEGTAGVVDFQLQTYNDAKYYEQAKRLATLEVSALIDGILEGGASEVWFLDGHGPGGIDYELMHCESKMVIGRPLVAPWGLDESFFMVIIQWQIRNGVCSVTAGVLGPSQIAGSTGT